MIAIPSATPIVRPIVSPIAGGVPGGADVVANGDFATDTVWAKGALWSIAGGKAVRAVDPTSSSLIQNVALVAGATYQVRFTIDAISAGGVAARLLGGTPVNGTTQTAPGTYTQNLVALAGNNQFSLIATGGTGATIDNVSLVQVAS